MNTTPICPSTRGPDRGVMRCVFLALAWLTLCGANNEQQPYETLTYDADGEKLILPIQKGSCVYSKYDNQIPNGNGLKNITPMYSMRSSEGDCSKPDSRPFIITSYWSVVSNKSKITHAPSDLARESMFKSLYNESISNNALVNNSVGNNVNGSPCYILKSFFSYDDNAIYMPCDFSSKNNIYMVITAVTVVKNRIISYTEHKHFGFFGDLLCSAGIDPDDDFAQIDTTESGEGEIAPLPRRKPSTQYDKIPDVCVRDAIDKIKPLMAYTVQANAPSLSDNLPTVRSIFYFIYKALALDQVFQNLPMVVGGWIAIILFLIVVYIIKCIGVALKKLAGFFSRNKQTPTDIN